MAAVEAKVKFVVPGDGDEEDKSGDVNGVGDKYMTSDILKPSDKRVQQLRGRMRSGSQKSEDGSSQRSETGERGVSWKYRLGGWVKQVRMGHVS